MIQVAKKVPFEDPNVLNAVRALYVVSNLIILGIYYYLKLQIDRKKGELGLSTNEQTGGVRRPQGSKTLTLPAVFQT